MAAPWLPPKALFALLCALELFVYMDRGSFASNGINDAMSESLSLTNTEDGALQTCFIGGLLLASPAFAQAAGSSGSGAALGPFRLIGVGQLVWVTAMVLSSLATGLWSMAAARTLVGIGEASFCSIAPVFIDDYAPERQRGLWLAIYYTFLPLGFAVGYGYGGLMGLLSVNWRVAFLIEACMMAPFVLFFLFVKPIPLKTKSEDEDDINEDQANAFANAASSSSGPGAAIRRALGNVLWSCKICFGRMQYSIVILASVMYTFVIGVLAFWGPKAGKETFNLHGTVADSIFAIMAALAGVFGTLSSGFIINKIQGRPNAIAETFFFMGVAMLAGMAFLMIAMTMPDFDAFIVFMGASLFCLFLTQAPTYAMSMQVVPLSMRSMACAMCTVAVHVFGDGPSPVLIGLLQDRLQNWRTTLSITSLILIPGILALAYGGLRSHTFDNETAGGARGKRTAQNGEGAPLLPDVATSPSKIA